MSHQVRWFPSEDSAFGGAAKTALASIDGRLDNDKIGAALAGLLRPAYPAVEVHRQHELARILDVDVWYVYRDGHSDHPTPPAAA